MFNNVQIVDKYFKNGNLDLTHILKNIYPQCCNKKAFPAS